MDPLFPTCFGDANSALPHSHTAAARRALSSALALVVLAGLVAVIATQGGGRPVAMVGSSKAELAFGDGLFRASLPGDSREGSVRAGVRPSSVAVPRHIAKVGLKVTLKPPQTLFPKPSQRVLQANPTRYPLPPTPSSFSSYVGSLLW